MSKVPSLEGRLVVHNARLYIDDQLGILDDDDNVRLQEVAWEPNSRSFVAVEPGDPGHNEIHGKNDINVSNGTTGPLYDGEGNLVSPGDPHHVFPHPEDPHYAADGGTIDRKGKQTYTRVTSHDDSVAPFVTGHTKAFTS